MKPIFTDAALALHDSGATNRTVISNNAGIDPFSSLDELKTCTG